MIPEQTYCTNFYELRAAGVTSWVGTVFLYLSMAGVHIKELREIQSSLVSN
jgi:hypothetical protein